MSESVYCRYCGQKFSSVSNLTANSCPRHPGGPSKGKHVPYQGDESDEYVCEYCGQKFRTIANLTSNSCPRHPNGPSKGKHSPML